MNALTYLRCPVCGGMFGREPALLRCSNGHCFDLAKERYVNLLPPGKGKNARTGDEKAMVRARQTFLATGLYHGISDGIASLFAKHLPTDHVPILCDSGCGEGYHTLRITESLSQSRGGVLTYGFDASKIAVGYAAKAAARHGYTGESGMGSDGETICAFCPANIYALPLADSSVDAVLSMFAPVAVDENLRVLREEGILLVASSGVRHLTEMRALLYDDVHYHEDTAAVYEGFTLVDTTDVRYTMHVPDCDTLRALWTMTPFYYRTTPAGKERLFSTNSLDCTVDVRLSVYKKAVAK